MNHHILFDFNLRHSYYSDGQCRDFTIEPLPKTLRLLRNGRLRMQTSTGALRVIAPCLDDNALFIPLPSDAVFRFYLHLHSEHFLTYTDLPNPDRAMLYLLGNESDTENFSQELARTSTERPSHLPKSFSTFAIVSIALPSTLYTQWTQTAHYTVSFQQSSIVWQYYLPSRDGTNIYSIEDSDNEITFDAEAVAPDDAIGQHLSAHYGSITQHRFVSSAPVPHRQALHTGLQLFRNGQERVFSSLPTPTLGKNGVRILGLV